MSPAATASCTARLRKSLAVTRLEQDGVVFYDILDPEGGQEFRFYEHEYLIASRLEPGLSWVELAAWVREQLGFETSPEGLSVFVDKIAELGFVEEGTAEADGEADEADASDIAEEIDEAELLSVEPLPDEEEAEPGAAVAFAEASARAVEPEEAPEGPAVGPEGAAEFAEALSSAGEREEVLSVPFAGPTPGPPPVTAPPLRERPRPSPPPVPPPSAGPPAVAIPGVSTQPPTPPTAAEAEPAPSAAAAGPPPAPPVPATAPTPPPDTETAAPPPTPEPPPEATAPARRAAAKPVPPRLPATPRVARRGFPLAWLTVPIFLLGAGLAAFALLARPRPKVVRLPPVRSAEVQIGSYTRLYGEARLTAPPTQQLVMPKPGRLIEVLPAGKRVGRGETLARLDGADRVLRELEHVRSRETHYRSKLEAATQQGRSQGERRMYERKVKEKERLVMEYAARFRERVLSSPSPGIVVAALEKTGTTVAASQPVLKFLPLKLLADFRLPVRDAGSLRAGQVATLVTASGREVVGRIESATPAQEVTVVRVVLDHADELKEGAVVRLVRAHFDRVVKVPVSAVARRPGGELVYVLDRDIAKARPVTVVDRSATDVLVARGLKPGERYALTGVDALSDGQRVQLLP